MDYKIGRDNFALTIFMPVDCKNGCSFCTSKKDYQINKPNLTRVFDAISEIGRYDIPFSDIVITGGEPFADITTLKFILGYTQLLINPNCNFYINTSLPKDTVNKAITLINNTDCIKGVNISRHLKKVFCDKVADIEDIKRIKKPIHFNCVLFEEPTDKELIEYCDLYSPIGQPTFRADYRTITHDNLHSCNYPLFRKLDDLFGFEVSTQCHVCHTDHFENGCVLHRGVENSHIEFKNYVEVNDIIIKQNGEIRYDWNSECIADSKVLSSLGLKSSLTSCGSTCNPDIVRPHVDLNRSAMGGCGYSGGCGGSSYYSYTGCGGRNFLLEPVYYSGCGSRSYSGGCGGSYGGGGC